MTTYFVRIELHGYLSDYPALHKWMQKQGFTTTIIGDNGSVYQLPTATYEIVSNRTCVDLRDWIRTNMPTCGSIPSPWILVIQSAGAAWDMDAPIRKAA